jgi:hypothetical protein
MTRRVTPAVEGGDERRRNYSSSCVGHGSIPMDKFYQPQISPYPQLQNLPNAVRLKVASFIRHDKAGPRRQEERSNMIRSVRIL